MEQLRKALDRMKRELGRLSATQRMLIGSLGVILLMTLFLVSQYAGGRPMVELLSADGQQETIHILRASDVRAELRDGKVFVPPESRRFALAALAERGALPDDTRILFDNLIDRQSWTNSREQNEQMYRIALQNELARVIGRFRGVRQATVVLDVPRPHGIGMIVREPTASVTVFTTLGGLNQEMVDAIAHLVAGSQAGLDPANVRVIDGSSGRRFAANSGEDARASAWLEHALATEEKITTTLSRLLSYIPGVVIAVTAEVDIAREQVRMTRFEPVTDEGGSVSLLGAETRETREQQSGRRAAEPGVRANATAEINSGSGDSMSLEESTTTTTMENHVGSTVTNRVDPKGMPTRLVASVNVPRDFVVAALRRAGGLGEDEEPSEEQVEQRFNQMRADITESVRPHLRAGNLDGVVHVSLTPVAMGDFLPADPQGAGIFGSGGGLPFIGEGLIETGLLALLAVVSLGMMVVMVRKASKQPEMPTAEELVGIPPPLEADSDLIGEADETKLPMAGIEVGAEDVERQRMLEQLAEMVKDDPSGSAKLLNRWIETDD